MPDHRSPAQSDHIRVALTQFASTTDVEANLATCLHMIDQAATHKPDLIVLPEFCNHLSVYDSMEHCRSVALDLDGPWIAAIGRAAQQHRALVVLAVTLRHDDGTVTISNVMLGKDGNVTAVSDKQVLMGNERQFLTPGIEEAPVIASPFGTIAMYSCMEGVVFEPPMSLALRGARLLTNSLNSFGLDEAALHIPVRAAENRVFVAAANKVGPLIPADRVESFAEAMGIPPEMLDGAGESQIVGPDGDVIVKAPKTGEAVVWADLDLSRADSKLSAAGVDLYKTRRPEVYEMLGNHDGDADPPASDVVVETFAAGDAAVVDILNLIAKDSGAPRLIALPEQFGSDGEAVHQIEGALAASPNTYVATSIVETTPTGSSHVGLLLGAGGTILKQRQIHPSPRTPWATVLGDEIASVDLHFGRIALIVGDDVLHPESFRLAAVAGTSMAVAPTTLLDPWLKELGIPERAAENRMNVVVASTRVDALGPIAAVLPPDFTLWLPDRSRPFDGTINTPDVVAPASGMVHVEIAPGRATNRLVSAGTDLVGGRPTAGAGRSVAQSR